ncbi:MAG TPA: RloB domain-containing protein [bacterium]|nr:RloB domain-containing protein [bacterium]
MSRTDPHKKKPRSPQRTLLIVCEGYTEHAFVRHLKETYFSRSNGHIAVQNAYGGDPSSIIKKAEKILASQAFDRCLLVFDSDRIGKTKIPEKVCRTTVKSIIPRPCIENLFLRVLNSKSIPRTTDLCKKEFDTKHLKKHKKTEPATYAILFPETLLEKKRGAITELDQLILIIQNCGW